MHPEHELESSPASLGSGALMWIAETPKSEGWWWWRGKPTGEARPIRVFVMHMNGHDCWHAEHPYGTLEINVMEYRWPGQRWAGPLTEPLDAPDAEPLPNDQAHGLTPNNPHPRT
jgi:hypothetical protein